MTARRTVEVICCPDEKCASLSVYESGRWRAKSYWTCKVCGQTWTETIDIIGEIERCAVRKTK